MTKKQSKNVIKKIFSTARYAGKHVIMVAGKIFTAKTGAEASHLFNELVQKYKGQTPLITYVPKEDTLILSHA